MHHTQIVFLLFQSTQSTNSCFSGPKQTVNERLVAETRVHSVECHNKLERKINVYISIFLTIRFY